ncbi:polysaccharide biosynthesis/export family protein [Hymenobacter glaciei]|uniref:polysaccharide biosynthesis/export family protein n=1 Tax=Hymenobacter glaciei TaxID=877209 RepID=UPI0031EDB051
MQSTAISQTPIENSTEPKIQTNDLLSISLSSLNPESNILFNSGMLLPANNNNSSSLYKVNEGYLVDKNGEINFPVMGKVQLANLTIEEATEKMTTLIKKYVKNPIVNVRFINFKVTVIGEVNRPSSFTISSERINILEALGLAGDMTAYGRRENVLVIREKNGVRTAARINLNNKEVLNSPFFYLQQNDILYVEPDNKEKLSQTNLVNRYIPIFVATITALAIFFGNARK